MISVAVPVDASSSCTMTSSSITTPDPNWIASFGWIVKPPTMVESRSVVAELEPNTLPSPASMVSPASVALESSISPPPLLRSVPPVMVVELSCNTPGSSMAISPSLTHVPETIPSSPVTTPSTPIIAPADAGRRFALRKPVRPARRTRPPSVTPSWMISVAVPVDASSSCTMTSPRPSSPPSVSDRFGVTRSTASGLGSITPPTVVVALTETTYGPTPPSTAVSIAPGTIMGDQLPATEKSPSTGLAHSMVLWAWAAERARPTPAAASRACGGRVVRERIAVVGDVGMSLSCASDGTSLGRQCTRFRTQTQPHSSGVCGSFRGPSRLPHAPSPLAYGPFAPPASPSPPPPNPNKLPDGPKGAPGRAKGVPSGPKGAPSRAKGAPCGPKGAP